MVSVLAALPKAEALPRVSCPAVSETPPVKVFAPERVTFWLPVRLSPAMLLPIDAAEGHVALAAGGDRLAGRRAGDAAGERERVGVGGGDRQVAGDAKAAR